jgi:hypothetical protein
MQRELGKTVTDFPELRLMVLDFYVENRDSLPDDLSGDERIRKEKARKGIVEKMNKSIKNKFYSKQMKLV